MTPNDNRLEQIARRWWRFLIGEEEPQPEDPDSCVFSTSVDLPDCFEECVKDLEQLPGCSDEATQLPKSIMRTSASRRPRTSMVRFQIDEMIAEPGANDRDASWKAIFLDRCRRLCTSLACRAILCILFGMLLPCSLIYVALICLHDSRQRSKTQFKEQPAAR